MPSRKCLRRRTNESTRQRDNEMASVTPSASNANLSGMLSSGRLTLGTRIVLSFGALFLLMLVMAVISYTRLRTIDDEAVSLRRDSVPGLYFATALRAASNESYATLERAIFLDPDAASMKNDLDRLPDTLRAFDKVAADYQ